VSDTAWSPEFVMQSLEVLPLFLRDGRIHRLKPEHAESLSIGMRPGGSPGELVVEALARYGLRPFLVHSTSCRHVEDRIVLTYVAVVRPEQVPSAGPLVPVPLGHVELARGDAVGPPPSIAVDQVVEHALRHLSWLVQDDPVVREEIVDWADLLSTY